MALDRWRAAESQPATRDGEMKSPWLEEAIANRARQMHEPVQSITSQEELRSPNELTTSKEEMQSVNEQLQKLNTKFQAKVDEVSGASNDIKNLAGRKGAGTSQP
jgi:hypothetical protein